MPYGWGTVDLIYNQTVWSAVDYGQCLHLCGCLNAPLEHLRTAVVTTIQQYAHIHTLGRGGTCMFPGCIILKTSRIEHHCMYHIVGMFGSGKVWQIWRVICASPNFISQILAYKWHPYG